MDKWRWVNAVDLKKEDWICLDYGYGTAGSPSALDFIHMKKYDIVFMYAPYGSLQTFITHDGIERKLPQTHAIWTYRED